MLKHNLENRHWAYRVKHASVLSIILALHRIQGIRIQHIENISEKYRATQFINV